MGKTYIKKNNILYYGYILCFYFFIFRNWLETKISFLSYADELLAIIGIPILLLKIKENNIKLKITKNSYWNYLCIVFLCGILGTVVYKYQNLKAVFADALLCTKFWLTLEVGKYFSCNFDIKKNEGRLFNHIRFLTIFFLTLVIIDVLHPVFAATTRYGLRGEQLFYTHCSEFASAMLILMVNLCMIREALAPKKALIYLIILSVLVLSSLRSKMFGSVLVFWVMNYFVLYKNEKINIYKVLLLIPVLLLIGWAQINFYFFSDIQENSARYQLFVKSLTIAKEHFPIGSGFGTFGSYHSSVYYSPLYIKYGLSKVYGLEKNAATFVSDSFWPMIIGQFGFIGTVGFAAAIFSLFRNIQQVRIIPSLYVTGLFIIAYLLIESTAASSFVHPSSMFFALILGYIIHFNSKKTKSNK